MATTIFSASLFTKLMESGQQETTWLRGISKRLSKMPNSNWAIQKVNRLLVRLWRNLMNNKSSLKRCRPSRRERCSSRGLTGRLTSSKWGHRSIGIWRTSFMGLVARRLRWTQMSRGTLSVRKVSFLWWTICSRTWSAALISTTSCCLQRPL